MLRKQDILTVFKYYLLLQSDIRIMMLFIFPG